MARRGRSLEVLVQHIETALNAASDASVESPKYIDDKVTGQPREHDVVISYPGHHGVLVAIDCKDWTNPVDAPAVEAFITKCQDTGISKGIIVASAGFTKPALRKASTKGIGCFTLTEAMEMDWTAIRSVEVHMRMFETLEIEVFILNKAVRDSSIKHGYAILKADGSVPDRIYLSHYITDLIDKRENRLEEVVGSRYTVQVGEHKPPFLAAIKDGTPPVPIDGIIFTGTFTVQRTTQPLSFHTYSDVATDKPVADAAWAEVSIGDWMGRLSVLREPSSSEATLRWTETDTSKAQNNIQFLTTKEKK